MRSVVGDGDGLDAAFGDERVDLGEVRRLGDPDRGGHRRPRGSTACAETIRGARLLLVEAPSRRQPCCRRRRRAARARRDVARRAASTISNAAVFCPSIRYGFTRVHEREEAPVRRSRGSSRAPRRSCRVISSSRAPTARDWADLRRPRSRPPGRGRPPSGRRARHTPQPTTAVLPGRGADRHPGAPASTAFETATAMPRSLNAPGRVHPLELEVQVDAEPPPEPPRGDQRRAALSEGDHRRVRPSPASRSR